MLLAVTAFGILACIVGMSVTRIAHRALAKLHAIENLEVHGREFMDAAELYKILGRPIPAPADHGADIRARVGQPPYRSPYS